MSLENKIAIVTGGADGIGYAIAERFLREKAKVIIADIDNETGAKAAKTLGKINTCTFIHCDVSQKLDVHNLIASTLDLHDRIDILVNNAGMVAGGDFLEVSEADFDRVIAVNLKGAFLCGQAVAKHMVSQIKEGGSPGSIINMSSAASSIMGAPNRFVYGASKAAVIGMTKSVAKDYINKGIRCNCICPGTVESPSLHERLHATGDYEAALKAFIARQPLGRIATAEEIALLVIYLASEESAFTTSQAHVIDGGWTS